MTTNGGPAANQAQEATMFNSLAAAKVAAAESFATDARIAAVYFEVQGREVRIARTDVAA